MKKYLPLILGGTGTGMGLLSAGLLRYYFLDYAYVAVTIHELGHCLKLPNCEKRDDCIKVGDGDSCPNKYCIMNEEHSIGSYISKWNYGLKYCSTCKQLVIEELEAHDLIDKELFGLIVSYNYSGNAKKVTTKVLKRFRVMFPFLNLSFEYFKIPKDEPVDHIGEDGEILEDEIFEILDKYEIDHTKYTWWGGGLNEHNMICEINNPVRIPILWGYSQGSMQYAFPPIKFYVSRTAYVSLVPITVGGTIQGAYYVYQTNR